MTNRFGRTMRVSKGISYNCMKCGKKWCLNAIAEINGVKKLIVNYNNRPYRRNPGHCSCGSIFNVPSISLDKLKGRYNDNSQQQGVIK